MSEYEATALEEMEQALGLGWAQLAPLIPWGDRFTGVSTAGREVEIERSYIWAGEPGGDILCEVVVYAGESRYEHGAKLSRVIARP